MYMITGKKAYELTLASIEALDKKQIPAEALAVLQHIIAMSANVGHYKVVFTFTDCFWRKVQPRPHILFHTKKVWQKKIIDFLIEQGYGAEKIPNSPYMRIMWDEKTVGAAGEPEEPNEDDDCCCDAIPAQQLNSLFEVKSYG